MSAGMRVDATLVAVGLGSNLDDPVWQVTEGLRRLAELPDTELCAASSLYRNPPMGPQDQPDYVNAAALLRTSMEPLPFLAALQAIEAAHGRVRLRRWGPRTLDLDLLLWGEQVLNLPSLTVPHPGLHERNFVLYPLAEIGPDLWVPGHGRVSELARRFPASGLVRIAPAGAGAQD